MADDFSKYEAMRNSGAAPEEVYQAAIRDGIDNITRIRLIRAVYSLSPRQAKEVMVRAEGLAASLDQFQSQIADNLLREATRNGGCAGQTRSPDLPEVSR
ncbi:MAG TPA: hypothetical protein VH575_20195 [Gemmataceae bacterium]|jgi:hypothetical protein